MIYVSRRKRPMGASDSTVETNSILRSSTRTAEVMPRHVGQDTQDGPQQTLRNEYFLRIRTALLAYFKSQGVKSRGRPRV
jgi:hypothetical protein